VKVTVTPAPQGDGNQPQWNHWISCKANWEATVAGRPQGCAPTMDDLVTAS